jgi:hypothetical protein
MDVEEKLRHAKSQFLQHTVDKKKFTESFWTRVENIDNLPRVNRRRWKWIFSCAGVLVVSGASLSPMIASAVQKVPLVHVVLNWVNGTDAAPYVRNVQQSATDRGITMTITDVLYGPSKLSFGYIVSPGQSGFPHGGAVGLGSPGMEFFVNGKQLHLQGIGEDGGTSYGFKGLVTLTDDGTGETLPDSFNLQIVLHKIGHKRGTWEFSVPVSRQNMKPEQTFLPMTAKKVGYETVTIKEVQLYPTGGKVDYDVTAPVGVKAPLNLSLFDQDNQILDTVTADPGTAQSHVTSGGFETWSYSQTFRVRNQKPTSLIVRPTIPSAEASPRLIPLSGPFPVSVDNGVFGKFVVTGTNVKGKQVVVHYQYVGKNLMAVGTHFRVLDLTHPNQKMGASLGEKGGPSGSNQYMDVYEYSTDVSSDQLVLQLPAPVKDVFEIPLRNGSS